MNQTFEEMKAKCLTYGILLAAPGTLQLPNSEMNRCYQLTIPSPRPEAPFGAYLVNLTSEWEPSRAKITEILDGYIDRLFHPEAGQ